MTSTFATGKNLDNAVAVKAEAAAFRTDANRVKVALLERVLRDQLATALARGFFGVTKIELAIQDGTIQHVRHGVERTER